MSTLTIENVDLSLLEKQRLRAHRFMFNYVPKSGTLNQLAQQKEGIDAIEGILSMLDEWSDNIYFSNKP